MHVLHELYHHILENKELDVSERTEEREANMYAKEVQRMKIAIYPKFDS